MCLCVAATSRLNYGMRFIGNQFRAIVAKLIKDAKLRAVYNKKYLNLK